MADSDIAWVKPDPTHVPLDVDPTKPSVARVYDGILGGKDNFAVDREVAEMAMAALGDGGAAARLNRAALVRAVRFDDATTTVVLADIREPDELLAMPWIAGFLDFSQPIGLILNAVIHHILDEEDPAGIVSRFKDAL